MNARTGVVTSFYKNLRTTAAKKQPVNEHYQGKGSHGRVPFQNIIPSNNRLLEYYRVANERNTWPTKLCRQLLQHQHIRLANWCAFPG